MCCGFMKILHNRLRKEDYTGWNNNKKNKSGMKDEESPSLRFSLFFQTCMWKSWRRIKEKKNPSTVYINLRATTFHSLPLCSIRFAYSNLFSIWYEHRDTQFQGSCHLPACTQIASVAGMKRPVCDAIFLFVNVKFYVGSNVFDLYLCFPSSDLQRANLHALHAKPCFIMPEGRM